MSSAAVDASSTGKPEVVDTEQRTSFLKQGSDVGSAWSSLLLRSSISVGSFSRRSSIRSSGGMGPCVVCLEEMDSVPGERLVVLPCGHKFHYDCAYRWAV